jgi:hypothetical protein
MPPQLSCAGGQPLASGTKIDIVRDGPLAWFSAVRFAREPAAFSAPACRDDDRARDDRTDTGHRHQPLAVLILVGERFNLAREPLDARI